MFKICAFADEISPDLDEQIAVLNDEGIMHIELRGVWGKNVLDLSDDEIHRIKETLHKNGMGISVIGSPIGKIKITDDFDEHLERFKIAIKMAHSFNTNMIRVFSFYIPEGESPSKYRDEVLRRMSRMAEVAAKEKVMLVHENESKIYGDTAERNLDIIESVGMDNLMACFDPANYICVGVEPYPFAYHLVSNYVHHVHIKDAIHKDGNVVVVPAGEGEGRIPEILADLKERKYQGYLSLEPHLAYAGEMFGFSGAERFKMASASLKKILDSI